MLSQAQHEIWLIFRGMGRVLPLVSPGSANIGRLSYGIPNHEARWSMVYGEQSCHGRPRTPRARPGIPSRGRSEAGPVIVGSERPSSTLNSCKIDSMNPHRNRGQPGIVNPAELEKRE